MIRGLGRRDVSPFTFPIDVLVLACMAMSSGLFGNKMACLQEYSRAGYGSLRGVAVPP